MAADIVIRSAAVNDEASVVGLWKLCGLTVSYNDPVQDFHFALGKANSDILVGTISDNRIVGSVMVGHDGHRGWIYYVATDPAYRLQKIGRSMVEAAEQWLRDKSICKIVLIVRPTNTQVVEFYNQLGFATVERVIMEKWLTN